MSGSLQNPAGRRPLCIQKVQALIAAQIVGRLGAAVQTVVSESRHRLIDRIRQIGVDQEIDVLGCSDLPCSCISSAGPREVIRAATRPLNLVFCSIAP